MTFRPYTTLSASRNRLIRDPHNLPPDKCTATRCSSAVTPGRTLGSGAIFALSFLEHGDRPLTFLRGDILRSPRQDRGGRKQAWSTRAQTPSRRRAF